MAGGYSGGDAFEGDRGAGRVCVRDPELIDFLYHRARPFLFSTSHPPAVAAACLAAFDVLEEEPERIEQLWENTRFWKKELGLLGFMTLEARTLPRAKRRLRRSSLVTAA